ncbi:MAG: DUF721 domain-containing protein [Chlamydiales bacterium]|nr:DUF721 domain-containing protein [Chlamydiales bacterium]
MRTPKNFDGTSLTSKEMSPLLSQVLAEISKQAGHGGQEILLAWERILGSKFAFLTKAVGVQDGVLTVKVKSSTLYSLLHQHEKPRLLTELQKQFPKAGIRDIVFRVGRFT